MYVLRHSPLWKHAVQPLSAVLLFLSSFMEDSSDDRWTISLSVLGCLLLSADLALWASYSSKSASAVAHTGFWAHVSALFIVSHLLEIFMYADAERGERREGRAKRAQRRAGEASAEKGGRSERKGPKRDAPPLTLRRAGTGTGWRTPSWSPRR
jgi:hypothetical protein